MILSDTGDSVYGGAPGDSTWLLRELLVQGREDQEREEGKAAAA